MNYKPLKIVSEEIVAMLRTGGDDFRWLQIESAINKGTATVLEFENKTYAVIARDGNDLVCLAIAGQNLKSVTKELAAIAQHSGCDFIRFVTKHKGLPRLLSDFKPIYFGEIYRIPTHENQH